MAKTRATEGVVMMGTGGGGGQVWYGRAVPGLVEDDEGGEDDDLDHGKNGFVEISGSLRRISGPHKAQVYPPRLTRTGGGPVKVGARWGRRSEKSTAMSLAWREGRVRSG